MQCFLRGEQPAMGVEMGLEVVQMLMTAYRSAEEGRTLDWDPAAIESFVPAVARGTWRP